MAKKPTLKAFTEAVKTYGGCKKDIAKAFNTSRQTVHNWCVKDKRFQELIDVGNDYLLDLAKAGLKHHLENQSEKSIHFTLDRLGRKDGFGHFFQIQDKSKMDEQLDEMSDQQILEQMKSLQNRIEKANGKK